MKPISVIIVNWNTQDYLRQCLDSVYATSLPCVHEVIVVDNASVDGSPEMVANDFPDVVLIRAPSNLGFARANNLAMTRASGTLFALVNSDALVHQGCLQTLGEYMRQHPDVGLVGPKVTGGDGNLQETCRHLPTLWNTTCRALGLDRVFGKRWIFGGYELPTSTYGKRMEVEVLSGCFCVARKQAVDAVGGLDEQFFFYGEDIDWGKRLRHAGWKLVFLPEATATHFGGGSSSKAPLRYSIEILRATLKYWRKHHGIAGQAMAQALLVLHHGIRLMARSIKRLVGWGGSEDSRYKLNEDVACLRWLFFRTEVSADSGRLLPQSTSPSSPS
jgi:GT2 family glycosyltransferase